MAGWEEMFGHDPRLGPLGAWGQMFGAPQQQPMPNFTGSPFSVGGGGNYARQGGVRSFNAQGGLGVGMPIGDYTFGLGATGQYGRTSGPDFKNKQLDLTGIDASLMFPGGGKLSGAYEQNRNEKGRFDRGFRLRLDLPF